MGCWASPSGRCEFAVPASEIAVPGWDTQTFTATAALPLAARGRLDLDRTVQSYAPDVLPRDYPPITVRHLTYTSGLPGLEIDHKDPTWFLANRFVTWTPRQLFDLAFWRDGAVKPLLFDPGTMQNYGNIDYLGARRGHREGHRPALRRGHPRRHPAPAAPARHVGAGRGPHARGYELMPDGSYVDITAANPTYQWAAAEIVSNAPDLDRFLTALLSGRLLPHAQTRLLFAVPDVPAFDGDTDPTNNPRAHLGHGLARLAVGDVVFSVNTLHMGGSEQPEITKRIIAAVAGLA